MLKSFLKIQSGWHHCLLSESEIVTILSAIQLKIEYWQLKFQFLVACRMLDEFIFSLNKKSVVFSKKFVFVFVFVNEGEIPQQMQSMHCNQHLPAAIDCHVFGGFIWQPYAVVGYLHKTKVSWGSQRNRLMQLQCAYILVDTQFRSSNRLFGRLQLFCFLAITWVWQIAQL